MTTEGVKEINTTERIKMVKAMEFLCRNLNNEDHFMTWIQDGVADGDIEYGDLEVKEDDKENLEIYLDDESFADLMDTFLYIMHRAYHGGGLYCDNVISKPCIS